MANAPETRLKLEPFPKLITVYATTWCGDCKLAKTVLDERGADYEWIDIDVEESAVETVLRLNGGYRTVPTLIFPDGTVLVEPTRPQIEAALDAGQAVSD